MKRAVILFSVLLAAIVAGSAAASLTGAVWTSVVDGSAVDHNIYAAKQDVYLNGGPNLLTGRGWIPPGNYYFQVTDPPGHTLLSTDAIGCRRFNVAPNGIVTYIPEGTCSSPHNTGADSQTGSTTIQLMPYDNSRNGEYKMWVTRVADYNPADSHSRFGFIPYNSKTDNFRVRQGRVTILGSKWEDANGNGIWDGGENGLEDWTIQIYRKHGNSWDLVAESLTAADGSYAFTGITQNGQYRICEVLQDGWTQTYPTTGCHSLNINQGQLRSGATLGPFNFGNRVIVPPKVRLSGVKYYDTNVNGERDLGESGLEGWTIHVTPVMFVSGQWVPDPGRPAVDDQTSTIDGDWGSVDVDPGMYLVCEEPPIPPWYQTGPLDQTLSIHVQATGGCYLLDAVSGVSDPAYLQLDFGNVRLGGGNAHTKGYWHAWNTGNARIEQAWINTINTEDPYDDPSDYSQTLDNQGNFRYNWVEPFNGAGNNAYTYPGDTLLARSRAEIADYLVDPVLGEMRLILAQQLLAMKLNVLSGDVDAWDLLSCDGSYMTSGDLIAAAEVAWAGTNTQLQTDIKDCLDAANNNLNWVLSLP